MKDCNIDLDLSLFKGELADGVFLTKAERNLDTKKIDVTYHEYRFRFCPNCGSKINGGDEDEDV